MTKCLICVILAYISTTVCLSTISESQYDRLSNRTLEGHASSKHYIHDPEDYMQRFEDLLQTRGSTIDVVQRNPNVMDFEAHPKNSNIRIYRITPSYSSLHSDVYEDFGNLKKYDFGKGQQQQFFGGGGWDFGGGGGGFDGNFGGGGGMRKNKEAKALFALMAPLILLAVFGPILATQAMLPWVTNGGLTTVSTVAGGKKRRKRSLDNRQRAGLQLFLEVQDFLARSGSRDMVEKMGDAFLKCQRYSERNDKCLERVSCEYTDITSLMDPEEKRIGRMVLRNVMSNPAIPAKLTGRLSKGYLLGRNHPGLCRNYWCGAVDATKSS